MPTVTSSLVVNVMRLAHQEPNVHEPAVARGQRGWISAILGRVHDVSWVWQKISVDAVR